MEETSKELKLRETILTENHHTRGYRSQPRYKNIVHLWEFLLELLAQDSCHSLISWFSKERREFKLKKPEEVAKRWGLLKGKTGMNYGKLSRALRYYYKEGIIKKVTGQRLVYKFNKLPYKYEPGMKQSLYEPQKMAKSLSEQEESKAKSVPWQMNPHNTSSSASTPTSTPRGKQFPWPHVPMPSRSILWYPATPCVKSRISGTRSRIIFPPNRTVTSHPLSKGVKTVNPVYPVFNTFRVPCTPIPVAVIQQTS